MSIPKKPSKDHEKKRESRDAALMKGTEELLTLGIDLEVLESTAESVERLAALDPPSREAQRAIACWLGFAEIPRAAAMLSAMEEKARDKELRREIRRSLFRLEQRGVPVPPRPGESPASALLGREEDRGYLSHVDGRGDQVVWYVKTERSGDYFVLSGVVNDRRGLVEADAGRVARPALRDLLEGTWRRFSLRLLQADAAWCDRVLHEAYKSSTSRRNPGVSRFPSYRMEISHRVPEKLSNPVLARLGVEEVRADPDLLAESAGLLEEPELGGWLLDPEWVVPHLESIREISQSPLVLNRYQREERLDKALGAACSAVFGGVARDVYYRRLEAMAYYLLLDGREEAARRALAVCLALGTGGSVEEIVSIPFVAALTRRSFVAAGEADKARAREEKRSSVIMKPGER